MALVELRNVIKDYVSDDQKVRALDGVSLCVAPGEVVALVGRSGCGKSTLLNLAGAMDFPTAGEALIDGHSTSGTSVRTANAIAPRQNRLRFSIFQLLHTLSQLKMSNSRFCSQAAAARENPHSIACAR